MAEVSQESVLDALGQIALPDIENYTAADVVTDISCEAGQVRLSLVLSYPVGAAADALKAAVEDAVRQVGAQAVDVSVGWQAPSAQAANQQGAVAGVKNIIAVASGKGGVGKSTVSVNLALALAAEGATVGILDADIYGPSQTHMLGIADKRPDVKEGNTIVPIRAYGLQCVSMGNLVTENTPMVWRGPMASGALQQLLTNAEWQDLDYLIVDMPPGTGDIQLTLAQKVPVTGAVIVTTPQDIALLDAKKGIEMFRKVSIPVLGVVENMAMHVCSNCGHMEAIFGEQGGQRLAEDYDTSLLGQLPLRADIRQQTDAGKPPVAADPESEVSHLYRAIARRTAAELWRQSLAADAGPEISISDD